MIKFAYGTFEGPVGIWWCGVRAFLPLYLGSKKRRGSFTDLVNPKIPVVMRVGRAIYSLGPEVPWLVTRLQCENNSFRTFAYTPITP